LRLNSRDHLSLENLNEYSVVSESLDEAIVPPGPTECLADAKGHYALHRLIVKSLSVREIVRERRPLRTDPSPDGVTDTPTVNAVWTK
jgi:hypothetical protein